MYLYCPYFLACKIKSIGQILKCQSQLHQITFSTTSFFIFQRKEVLTFHVNHLPSRWFTWSFKTYFLWKINKKKCSMLQILLDTLRVKNIYYVNWKPNFYYFPYFPQRAYNILNVSTMNFHQSCHNISKHPGRLYHSWSPATVQKVSSNTDCTLLVPPPSYMYEYHNSDFISWFPRSKQRDCPEKKKKDKI